MQVQNHDIQEDMHPGGTRPHPGHQVRTCTGARALRWAVPLFLTALGCQGEQLAGVKAEVQETSVKLDLPPVPAFQMPAANPDGTHSVAEMRLREVRVKGHIIWIYDCATAIRTPDMNDKELERLLREEPERCERPNLYLGDAPTTPTDKGIWVVEVPRAPRPDELKTLPKEVLKEWPEVPKYATGDQVILTGTWAVRSPKGFANSDGLLVYGKLEQVGGGAPE
jgi:hypothetical protein